MPLEGTNDFKEQSHTLWILYIYVCYIFYIEALAIIDELHEFPISVLKVDNIIFEIPYVNLGQY